MAVNMLCYLSTFDNNKYGSLGGGEQAAVH